MIEITKNFSTIVDGGKFTMKRKEEITSVHYFVRATSNNFNSTTNETYYTQSVRYKGNHIRYENSILKLI